ncbi:MAG: EAL domain-containing protein [Acidobacteria bacterium]|nr:MAG: EAL domain-containing protein [Acidobacteriota bacterium]REK02007.1 MAG: EAL domain-containing protein [Acidobacteriota bacterium]REK14965.1 MAG: EAL domain-containing protein [Acidobacteriota bacterium]REK45679.1 MAG: EAL domain-containing protein [Acidobacteriota bacterium]
MDVRALYDAILSNSVRFRKKIDGFMYGSIAVGLACISHAFIRLPYGDIDLYLVLLTALTLLVGTRISIPIPRFKSHIAVSDTFVFLALILYGAEIAILLAAAEALLSSWRFCKRKITVFTNASVMAICTTIVAHLMDWSGLLTRVRETPESGDWSTFVVALSVMAIAQFITNTTFAAVYGALKSGRAVFEVWRTTFLWTFITYAVGAFCAGGLFLLNQWIGIGVVFATFPVILLIYLSYKMYLENVEMSLAQADQANKHAKVLEEQSIALRESEERFRSAFDNAPIGIALVSATGNWLKVNHALCEILDYSPEEFLETDFQSMTFAEDLGEMLVKIHELVNEKIFSCQLEIRFLDSDGKLVWTSWSASPVEQIGTEERHLIFQILDITDKKVAEEKLQYEATHDSLTRLPNRSLFMARLENAVETARRNPSYEVAVLFIDLDRFKLVNDSLGHMVGDQLLIGIARRLGECLRPSDLVARLGGDEFVILVEGKGEGEDVTSIAERVQEQFAEPFELAGNDVYSSASIGILKLSDTHFSAEDMMRDADTAMYHAKKAGKGRHEIFDPSMHRVAIETFQLETDLRKAIDNREFFVFYQPIYSLETDETIGFEALARWNHPEKGFIPPNDFIPVAEELGLIHDLGEQILTKACTDMRELLSERPLILSVNISCKQFGNPDFVEGVRRVLLETGFPPSLLKFEITESVFLEHREDAIAMLSELRNFGVEIDIDDFGTGYSNLNYLTQLPISTLKIDRSFIESMETKGRNLEIVQTIIALASGLGIKVIAEGVENREQLHRLKALRCSGAQGFFFAKPMDLEDVKAFIKEPGKIPLSKLQEIPYVPSIQ